MLSLAKKHNCCTAESKAPLLLKEGWQRLREAGVVNGRPASEIASSAAKWLLPSALLLFIPKCPLCIVAYVAMFSGIGLSISTATNLRIALIAISSAALVYLASRCLFAFISRET
jgi:hypothetical protein